MNFHMHNTSNVHVPEELRLEQGIQINGTDLTNALESMAKNKTPGYDGLTTEFYLKFWRVLKLPLLEAIIESYDEGILFDSAKFGILNLIPKPGKDSRKLTNLRPITLLNVDYKILEKAIANKIQPSLYPIINENQSGFMPGRSISVNIHKLLDILNYTDEKQIEAFILSCDYKKCFDKIDFSALQGSLRYFGFHELIVNWTAILYNKFEVKIQNCGKFSKKIDVQQGVHQGGPASSLYFLVVAEIIAINLRNKEEIRGFPVDDIINVLSQFADDMDVFSLYDQESLNSILQEISKFHDHTGFTLSYEKTTLYRIGSLKKLNAKLYTQENIRWSNDTIKVLGVDIYHDQETLINKNYDDMVIKAKTVTEQWSKRHLSLFGKIAILNTLVASLFIYKMFVLSSMSNTIVRKVEQIMSNFLWGGRKSKITLRILQNAKYCGGAGLTNIRTREKSIKVSWIKILNANKIYANMVYKILGLDIKEKIWKCTLSVKHAVLLFKNVNKFWCDVITAWCELHFEKIEVTIENQIIWYNSYILIGDKPIFLNKPWKKGLNYVYQLFENGSVISVTKATEQYGLSFIELNAIVQAMPQSWRDFFKCNDCQTFIPIKPSLYDKCLEMTSIPQYAYKQFGQDINSIDSKRISWSNKLQAIVTKAQFQTAFKRIFYVTNIPRLRSFQFRLLHHAIVTNEMLHKWKIIDSSECTFCHSSVETTVHLFLECHLVKSLWDKVKEYVKKRFSKTIHLDTQSIIFNKTNHSQCVDLIILLTKQYIYRKRCAKELLTWPGLNEYVHQIENKEKYIAIKNGILNKHEKKWGIY